MQVGERRGNSWQAPRTVAGILGSLHYRVMLGGPQECGQYVQDNKHLGPYNFCTFSRSVQATGFERWIQLRAT
jgi:hypothetical protein